MASVIEQSQELHLPARGTVQLVPGRRYFADHPLTVEEFYELVEEGTLAELVDGVIVVPSPTSDPHEDLFGWLLSICRTYVEERNLGVVRGAHTSVRVDEYNTRIPDLLFVARRRRGIVKRLDVQGAPDWVVEIGASDSARREAVAKQPQYERLGVAEIWKVDVARRKLTIRRKVRASAYETVFEGAAGNVQPERIPGLVFQVRWFWMSEAKRPSVHRVVTKLLEQAGRDR
jgi:Uma2 family endonuclease